MGKITRAASIAALVLAMHGASRAGDSLTCATVDVHQAKMPDYMAGTLTTVKAVAGFSGAQKTAVCAEISAYMFVDRVQCTNTQFLSARNHRSSTCASNSECNSGMFAVPERAASAKPGLDTLCVTYENRIPNPGTAALTVELH